jgi:hypothetical protein
MGEVKENSDGIFDSLPSAYYTYPTCFGAVRSFQGAGVMGV